MAGPLPMLLLVALLLVVVGGCAGQRATDYKRLTDRRFPAREAPARPTDKAPRTLIAEGYVLIGVVEVRHPVRRCFPRHCRDLGERGDPTAEAGRRAAELGGDLMVLSADDVMEHETMFYEGQCVHTGPIAPLTGNECREREIIRGVREVAVSRGTVWRHGPELARGPENELAWRLYVGEVPFDALDAPDTSGQ